MLLATMVVLLQIPFAPAAKLQAQPQAPATVLYAENSPAKLTPLEPPANIFAPAATNDLFDRDKIRLVDLPGVAATDGTSPDGKSPDATKTTAMSQPGGGEESSSLLAEVHIPTRVEPPDP